MNYVNLDKKMIIEIHGGNFKNKGAMKMLTTTIDRIKAKYPNAVFVCDESVGTDSDLSSLNIKKIFFKRTWMGSRFFLPRLAIQSLIAKIDNVFPFLFKDKITLNKIDAIVDIAGFAYSEQWGSKPSRDFSVLARWYKKNNKKVIMLPQAFGPFESQELKTALSNIIKSSDLICARDAQSKSNLISISDNDVINKYVDITLFESALECQKTDAQENITKKVAIIPNVRMLDKGGEFWKENYITTLVKIINISKNNGHDCCVYVHDLSGEDSFVAKEISAKIEVDVIHMDDPWELKKELSKMDFVVGSRFHGLVAALSQGVPVAAIGWSHKYDQLLSEFELSEYLINEKNFSNIESLMLKLCDSKHNNELRSKLLNKYDYLNTKNEEMWERVYSIIK